jgi:MGT family glycosyltransferase
MTFGTVLGYMSIAPEVFRAALEAVEGFPARVLLTTGNHLDPASLGPLPSNVHVEAWIDQAEVLPHADLVVCHGGSGTAFGALAAGVPMVVVPVFADQFENARRIAGVGAALIVEGRGDAHRTAEAIATVLRDPSFRGGANGIAAEMAGTGTVDDVLDDLLHGAESPGQKTTPTAGR